MHIDGSFDTFVKGVQSLVHLVVHVELEILVVDHYIVDLVLDVTQPFDQVVGGFLLLLLKRRCLCSTLT